MSKDLKLSIKERELLNMICNSSSSSSKAKLKAKVILLRTEGKSISEIILKTKLSKRTVINYVNQYIEASNKAFFIHSKGKVNQSELSSYPKLVEEFREKPPLTYKEATERVFKITGLKRSETQVINFLNRKGIYTEHTRLKIKYMKRSNIKYKTRLYREELKSEEICNEFELRPPLTYKEAAQRIEKLTGLKRSELQVKQLLNKNNIYTPKSRKKESQDTPDFQDDDFISPSYYF